METPPASTSEEQRLDALIDSLRPRRVVVVTGAGISAESGLPTYRGDEGYWTETSANYQPEEIGYLSTFRQRPREGWQWALTMRGICEAAEPNEAHRAIARLEQALGDDFLLITQNVDGLHLRAGSSPERTIEAHGNLRVMRVLDGGPQLLPIPDAVVCPARGEPLSDESWAQLTAPDGRATRPHTMFFDEAYDEVHYRADTATAAASTCDLLVVIGTSGATALPWSIAVKALEAEAAIITIDPDETPFGVHARNRERVGKGLWLRGSGCHWVPRVVEALLRRREQAEQADSPRVIEPDPSEPAPSPSRRAPTVYRPVSLQPLSPPEAEDFDGSRRLAELLGRRPPRRVVVLTGAGISAESGIPTFRGANGYWVIGARANRPTTYAEFQRDPKGIWAFHLHRRSVCNRAEPNAAHLALAALDAALGDDLRVITQNVDGLHARAGNDPARLYELHGTFNLMRGIDGDLDPIELPSRMPELARDEPLPDEAFEALVMPDQSRARPHVLLWDEAYNEVHYRSESALAAARACDLLVVIGTSGSAAMPYAIAAEAVLEADATLIDINLEDNAYAEHARDRSEDGKGLSLRGPATRWVPELVEQLVAVRRLS